MTDVPHPFAVKYNSQVKALWAIVSSLGTHLKVVPAKFFRCSNEYYRNKKSSLFV